MKGIAAVLAAWLLASPVLADSAPGRNRVPAASMSVIKKMESRSYLVDAKSGKIRAVPGDRNVTLNDGDRLIVLAGSQTVFDSTGFFVFSSYTDVTLDHDNASEIAYDVRAGVAEAYEYDYAALRKHRKRPSGHTIGRRRRKLIVKTSTSISPSGGSLPSNGYSHQFKATVSETDNPKHVIVHCEIGLVTVRYSTTLKKLVANDPDYEYDAP